MKNITLMSDWYEELIKSDYSEDEIDLIFGRVIKAVFCDEEPDVEGLDRDIKSMVYTYYTQAIRMQNNRDNKVQTAGNRKGRSKYNANYIYVLAKIGLKQSECMNILGYPNLNSIKDSEGWKASRNAEHPDLEHFEASFAATVEEMRSEIPHLVEKVEKLKLKFNPWQDKVEKDFNSEVNKVEKVEIDQLFNKKVEIECQPDAEKVEKVELNQPNFPPTFSTKQMNFNDF